MAEQDATVNTLTSIINTNSADPKAHVIQIAPVT
jgi:hypothetical protein